MAMNDGRVVSNFIIQAIRNQNLTVYGDGSQTRSLCYVDDLISGLVKLFFNEETKGPINLGNPEPLTMKELAEEIINLTNSSSEIEFQELPLDDPKQREPDITLAKNILKWSPIVSRDLGLKNTVDYFSKLVPQI
jgi:UDP-glucuronate decarboxylase